MNVSLRRLFECQQAGTQAICRAAGLSVSADDGDLSGSILVADGARPRVPMVNRALGLELPEDGDIDGLLDRIDAWYAQQGTHCFGYDPMHVVWEPTVEAALQRRGAVPSQRVIIAADGLDASLAADGEALVDGLSIVDGKTARREALVFFEQMAALQTGLDAQAAGQIAEARLAQWDAPGLTIRLAMQGGHVVSVSGYWLGEELQGDEPQGDQPGRVAVLEQTFTLPRCRGQGVASALMHQALQEACAAGATGALLEAPASCPHFSFYTKRGFAPVGGYLRYKTRGNA